MEGSEFGKGLVICLVKFAEHQWRWYGDKITYKKLGENRPDLYPDGYMTHAAEMHMNGAADHLYEIEVPQGIKRSVLGKKVAQLKDKGLAIGHGYLERGKWTEEDVLGLYELAREIALLIDKKMLGLKAELGQW